MIYLKKGLSSEPYTGICLSKKICHRSNSKYVIYFLRLYEGVS
jgi:hypothetical protein